MATTATAVSSEVHSLTADRTVLNETLYTQVTDLLTVSTETQQHFSEFESVPDFQLANTLLAQYDELCSQMLELRGHCEKTVLTSTHAHWWPRVMTAGSQTDGLYCLRTALPNDKCNIWSLKLMRSRRTATHWEEVTAPESLFPEVNRPHWSYTRTEHMLYSTVNAHLVTMATVPGLQFEGLPLATDQSKSTVMFTVPMSIGTEIMTTGRAPSTLFTNGQVNLWFTARSALLRMMQMHWNGSLTLTEAQLTEPLVIIAFNPVLNRITGGTVHNAGATPATVNEGTVHRLLTFNRQWIDHCLSTDSLEDDFILTTAELASGTAFQLNFTVNQMAEIRHELNGTEPFGLHCRALLGHLVLPLSVLKKYGDTQHCFWNAMYGTDLTEDRRPGTTDAKKYKITVDGITDGITFKMEVSTDD